MQKETMKTRQFSLGTASNIFNSTAIKKLKVDAVIVTTKAITQKYNRKHDSKKYNNKTECYNDSQNIISLTNFVLN